MTFHPQTSVDYETLYEQLKHPGSWALAIVTEIIQVGDMGVTVVNPCIVERLSGDCAQSDGALFIGYPGRSIGMMRIYSPHSIGEKTAFIQACEHHSMKFTPLLEQKQ
jgi:hypothetical protein